ncbi:Hypothetical protein GLP15_589 [Giardia lamblia P15]|uniref:Uncharacterized protein n=1 Tax=Giardia intestinalis (strain P15) TaxID=658858 RepID=E1F558_GIAIA|nr:Hypothetical protein GLP15_589 [Giardia lamblia P15]
MENNERKTSLSSLLRELEDNAVLRLRCLALEEEIQRLNLVLQNIRQADDILSPRLYDNSNTTNIPCGLCTSLLPKVAELQGVVTALNVAIKEATASSDTLACQIPSALTDNLRENIRDAYLWLRRLLEAHSEEVQEDCNLKQISIEILKLLAQRKDYNKLLEDYKALATENAELMKRITQLEGKKKLETVTEKCGENGQRVITDESNVELLNNQMAILTHRIETLTLLNSSLKNELLIKTKSLSVLQSKLENYVIMQQSYLSACDKIEELCERTSHSNKEDDANMSNGLLVRTISNTLTAVADQLLEISTLFTQRNPAETQPTLRRQPHSWGITNIIAQCSQLKDSNQRLQLELEVTKYEQSQKLKEQQEIVNAKEKHIEELLTKLSAANTLDPHSADSHQPLLLENSNDLKGIRDLQSFIEHLENIEKSTVTLSIHPLKQILVAATKSQIAENILNSISSLRSDITIDSLKDLSATLSAGVQDGTKYSLSIVTASEGANNPIFLTEKEYHVLKETISGLTRLLLYSSDILMDHRVKEDYETEAITKGDSYDVKSNENEESGNTLESKQSPGSVEEELLLEEINKIPLSETESILSLDKGKGDAVNDDKDTSPPEQCSSESGKNTEKGSISKPTIVIRSLKKPTQQKRKISVCLSSPDSNQSSQKMIDSGSEDEFSKEKSTTDRWKALDTEDIW